MGYIHSVTAHKCRFICAVSKEKEDSRFALQQRLFSYSAGYGGVIHAFLSGDVGGKRVHIVL